MLMKLNLRTVFLFGESERYDEAIAEEARHHGDVVQASFVDAYRNMTYKHLLGYRYRLDELIFALCSIY